MQTIGTKVKRVDAYEKVTGKAVYGDDIQLHDMLFAACRYTDIPCGKIKKIDLTEARKVAEVEAIALYKDVPGEKRLGPIRRDQFILVNDEVFFSGDVVAVVAARTKDAAQRAADSIHIEYEPLAGIYSPEEAIKPEARLIHPEFKSNVVVHYPLRKGDVQKGFSESEQVIERTYRTGFHEHAYIEPETVTAVPDAMTQGVKIYGSVQNPFTTRKVVALAMGLKFNQVNVVGSTLGGSFGGKDDVVNYMAARVALLAKMTGKPVKLTNNREDSMKESYKRHPYVMNYKVGFNNDGKLKSMKINIIADSGAYSSQSFFVTWRSVVQATGPYEIENVETDIRAVYTNNTYTAAFRGFGSPQVIFAQESLMDEIAELVGKSPLEIRQLNGYKQGSITASGQPLTEHKVSLDEVISKAMEKSDYQRKRELSKTKNTESERFKYGIGLACSFRGCSLGAEGTDMSSAIVSVQADGSVYVLTGVHENGQGLRTSMCMVASEVLGVDIEDFTFIEPSTSGISDGGPTVASRGTMVGGSAVLDAANIVKKQIFEVIKSDLKVETLEETEWKNNFISRKKAKKGVEPMAFSKAAEKAYWKGVNLSAYGWFISPHVSWDEHNGRGNAYFTYVYACHIAEIKVDTSTGKIEVENMTAAHDVGKVINRTGIEGQVYGGVTQGVGYTVLEDYNIQNGQVKSTNLDEYLLPTIKDVGNIDILLIENEDIYGPFGAKSIGEPTIELASASINNALFFATSKRSYQIPLTLEQVFLGKNLKKPERQSEIHMHESCKIHLEVEKHSPYISDVTSQIAKSLGEALDLLYMNQFKVMAGGTDVIIGLRQTNDSTQLLDISHLKELATIKETEHEVEIGSGCNFTQLIDNKAVKKYFPLLVQACQLIGSKQVRNRGTIGGNIANAAPCADSVPPLLAYDARLIIQSKLETRVVAVQDFIIKNYQTVLKPEELITHIIIPKPAKEYKFVYHQLGRRNAVYITRLSVGALVAFNSENKVEECKIISGSLFDKPMRIKEIENLILGKEINNQTISEIEQPLTELIDKAIGKRWSSEYKLPVFVNLLKDMLKELIKN